VFRSRALLLALLFARTAMAEPLYDPTRPPSAAVSAPPEADAAAPVALTVSFVRIGEQGRRALINGVWVGEGDRVAGAEVVRIGRDMVTLRRAGRVIELPVAGMGMNKRPAQRVPAAESSRR